MCAGEQSGEQWPASDASGSLLADRVERSAPPARCLHTSAPR